MGFNVLIAGGGIGGLCLAQGLRRAGIGVTVFERDETSDARGQGYRFRVDADGDAALHACLPESLYRLYRATANRPSSPPADAYDCQMNLVYRLPNPGNASGGMSHLAVNRRTLREVLLTGLDDCLHFGHRLVAFEQDTRGIRATFANGQVAEGDLLVGADGVHSLVRRHLLPDAVIAEADAWCVYGRTLRDAGAWGEIPEPLHSGFTPVLGPDGQTLAFGPYRPERPFAEAVTEFAPEARLTPTPDYLMWIFVAPKTDAPASDAPADLHRFVLDRTADWHPDLRRVLEDADVAATFPVTIRSARPIPAWNPSRVTLLGDAIHVMTPAGGTGANTALRDAASLVRELSAVSTATDFVAAVGRYEAEMRDCGFAAVERSRAAAAHLYRIPFPELEARP